MHLFNAYIWAAQAAHVFAGVIFESGIINKIYFQKGVAKVCEGLL
jgi:hypothetical protein